MYNGSQGVYSYTFEYEKKPSCIVCSDASDTRHMAIAGDATLKDFIGMLRSDPSMQLQNPSIVSESHSLYLPKPPQLEKTLRPNLDRPLTEMINDGEVLTVSDPILWETSLAIKLSFSN